MAQQQTRKDSFDISHSDQLRIIRQTGIFSGLPSDSANIDFETVTPNETGAKRRRKASSADADVAVITPLLSFDDDVELEDESELDKLQAGGDGDDEEGDSGWLSILFDTFLWTVPFLFLFVAMDVAVHAQYGQPMQFLQEVKRLANFGPGFFLIALVSLQPPIPRLLTPLLFLLSAVCGAMLIWTINHAGYLAVMRQAPGFGVVWIWGIVQLDLSYAIANLAVVGGWAWWKGEKLTY